MKAMDTLMHGAVLLPTGCGWSRLLWHRQTFFNLMPLLLKLPRKSLQQLGRKGIQALQFCDWGQLLGYSLVAISCLRGSCFWHFPMGPPKNRPSRLGQPRLTVKLAVKIAECHQEQSQVNQRVPTSHLLGNLQLSHVFCFP